MTDTFFFISTISNLLIIMVKFKSRSDRAFILENMYVLEALDLCPGRPDFVYLRSLSFDYSLFF